MDPQAKNKCQIGQFNFFKSLPPLNELLATPLLPSKKSYWFYKKIRSILDRKEKLNYFRCKGLWKSWTNLEEKRSAPPLHNDPNSRVAMQ